MAKESYNAQLSITDNITEISNSAKHEIDILGYVYAFLEQRSDTMYKKRLGKPEFHGDNKIVFPFIYDDDSIKKPVITGPDSESCKPIAAFPSAVSAKCHDHERSEASPSH